LTKNEHILALIIEVLYTHIASTGEECPEALRELVKIRGNILKEKAEKRKVERERQHWTS
jgi:hypothetical protein